MLFSLFTDFVVLCAVECCLGFLCGMRRSAAPSQKGPAPKKAFFIPPFLSAKTDSDRTSVSAHC